MSDHGTFVAVYPDGRRVRLRWPMRKQLDNMEISPETGASYPRGRLFFDVLSDLLEDDDEDTRTEDDEGDDVEKAQPEKETSNMDSFEKMVKDRGIVAVAKTMVDEQRAYGIDETKFTQLATEHAQRLYPNDRPDTAFAKLFSGNGPDGVVLRKAHAIAKAAGPMFDVTIVHPGDETYRTVNDTESSEAYQTLQSLADKLHAAATGKMTKEQAFAAAFTDPANRELAQKAHRTPTAPANGAYPFPR